ncbi:uncharacterized protein LOC130744733 [Lotus japonicus]|uniref:uncharacterized protein LOC130744733 n=1 Tax=Lotus japonicus TaxID=34305 RepID=UPI00258B8EC6|nr:uncharacterized protein LOC130744733 [Lotus japonicus]
MAEFMGWVVTEMELQVVADVQRILFSMWEARNKLIFEEKPLSMASILARATTLVCPPPPPSSFFLANGGQGQGPGKWVRPAVDIVKVNVDAAVGRDKMAGFGMVARDNAGEVLAAAAKFATLALSPTVAEALCLRWAMELSVHLGFRRVQFETDYLPLFQAWKKANGTSYLFSIIYDCRSLLSAIDYVDFSFVRRQGKFCADYLARHAFTFQDVVWIEEGPPGLSSFLCSDILASMPDST